ncbi:Hsp70 family protein, partial [bacterium]|nr:Hsp70 family protein [bacterium]
KLIGFFNIQDLSKKHGSEEIVLSMNLDLNGILTVVATEKKTGFNKRITIDNSFDHEDISDSVDKISEYFETENLDRRTESGESSTSNNHADKMDNGKEDQKVYIAKTMIEKAENKLDEAAPEDAREMKKIIHKLKEEIEANNVEEVELLTDELTDILFYID